MFNNNSIHHEITKIKLGISLSNVYLVVPVLGKKSGHSQDGKALVCVTTRSLMHTIQHLQTLTHLCKFIQETWWHLSEGCMR